MAWLEVCERKQRIQPLQRPVPRNLLASKDKPQQGKTRQEGAERPHKKRPFGLHWLLLAFPDRMPPENVDGFCFVLFLLRHMSYGCPRLSRGGSFCRYTG